MDEQARSIWEAAEIERPDAAVTIVRAEEARTEQYRTILPRRDGKGWRMARIEAEPWRRELVHPEVLPGAGLHLSVVTLPPGYRDGAHWHVMGEKVMYVTEGKGVIASGRDLEREDPVGAGDVVHVPPYAVHAPRNDGEEPFTFVMVANAPMDVTVAG